MAGGYRFRVEVLHITVARWDGVTEVPAREMPFLKLGIETYRCQDSVLSRTLYAGTDPVQLMVCLCDVCWTKEECGEQALVVRRRAGKPCAIAVRSLVVLWALVRSGSGFPDLVGTAT